MVKKTPLILLMAIAADLAGQGSVGSWSDHLSYSSARSVAISSSKVYASTGSSIMVYDKEYGELKKMTRVQGLSETSISTIAWSEEQEALIVAYTSTNIDIIRNNAVNNIPDIKRKYIPGRKEIFSIKARGRQAWLSTSFGIVVIDITRNEISDTWKPGDENGTAEVYDMIFHGDKVYAATSTGVYYADAGSAGLSYFGNWHLVTSLPSPSGSYNSITGSDGKIYVNRNHRLAAGDSVFAIAGQGASLFSYQQGLFNISFMKSDNGFLFISRQQVRVFTEDGTLVKTINSYNPGTVDISHAAADGNDIWIADISSGLVSGEEMSTFSRLSLPGPFTNNVISLSNSQGRTFIAGGAVDNAWNNLWRPLQVFIHENSSWNSIYMTTLRDAMRILPDPADRNRFWVSTWGAGLLEFENNNLKNTYNNTNSPLQTIIPGQPYVRIAGLAMDSERNIWITQTGVPGSIKVLMNNGSWITFPFTIEAPTIGDIIITRTGLKWIVLPRGYGIFVLDDNNTPENFSDDRTRQILIRDNDNKVITNVYSIAEDLDGNIWVGTDQGPAIYYNPDKIFEDDIKAFRVKVPRNDGTGLADYMLGTEIITSVAVDGANRKWLGTFSSGAYLLSEDGTKQLENFTEENSPLLSNTIASVKIDDRSGEVWFGTSKGVISFRGDATTGGNRFGDVYTFPNPVRETYQGNVTIAGLMRNTRVKITDVSGNLVFSTISDGGQATWDLTTYNGRRVSTGVYLVFCAGEDGSEAAVTKMLVVR